MNASMLHIYRNTPQGRETLLQSAYFCRRLGVSLRIYIPTEMKFLLYFEHDAVQVDLDSSYLTGPTTALDRCRAVLRDAHFDAEFVEAKDYSASNLPDVSTDWEFMCCPRVISELSSKMVLGYIGSKVRKILMNASFPVLMPSPVYKPWKSVAVLFGGSHNGIKAFNLGVTIARNSGLPMDVFTQAGKGDRDNFEALVEEKGLGQLMQEHVRRWEIFESGTFGENLFFVPHDALVVLGAFGHGLIRDIMFGSTMETVQTVLPNNMLIVGPKYAAPKW
jgi:hypothetical protein